VSLIRLEGILVELLVSLARIKLPARQFILEMFLTIIVKSERYGTSLAKLKKKD
jgi:hypothetical protein